jgi:hypothetical protein
VTITGKQNQRRRKTPLLGQVGESNKDNWPSSRPMPIMSSSGTWFSLHDVGTSVGNAFHSFVTGPPFWTHRSSSNEAGRRTPSWRSAS